MTHLCWDFELLNHSELKEHANAGFDEVKLWDGEVAEGEQVQVLTIDVVSGRAGSFLKQNIMQFMQKMLVNRWRPKKCKGLKTYWRVYDVCMSFNE